MTWTAMLFWFTSGCIFFTYVGYPLVLMLIGSMQQLRSDWRHVSSGGTRRIATIDYQPSVAVLVAAYNEERFIAERVENLLSQDYPAHGLRIYVGSDASADRTNEILRSLAHPRLSFVNFSDRRGKPSVVNDLAALASEDILVFTDANTSFSSDTVSKLVRHFQRPEVGCVCGELRLISGAGTGDNQDHIYWRYERLLKFFESRLHALLGANGGVYALRRSDYSPIPASTIVDDFWISMQVVESGRICHYDPEAVATETIPDRIGDEFRRRVRIGTGNYQALARFAGLLHPGRGMLSFTFLAHKCMRWLVPHCLILALASNIALAGQTFYSWGLLGQFTFYALAGFGWWRTRKGVAPSISRLPLFFVSMNLGLLLGFWRYVAGQTSGVWARSAR